MSSRISQRSYDNVDMICSVVASHKSKWLESGCKADSRWCQWSGIVSERDDRGHSRIQIKFDLLVVDGACWLSMSMVRSVDVVVGSKWNWK